MQAKLAYYEYKNKSNQSVNVGVGTGKFQLNIYIRPLDIYFTVSNDEKGIKEAIKKIQQHSPGRIDIEATGRLEMPFIVACANANLPFVVANPIHIKRFAGAIGQRAKTDKLDAQLIAHYGEAIQPKLSQLKPDTMQAMSDLVARRNQLLVMQTMEKKPSSDSSKRTRYDHQTYSHCLQKPDYQN